MNWELIGVIAQILGLATVVGSLVYIAIQTRQTKEHAVASSDIEWLVSWNAVISSWANEKSDAVRIKAGFANFQSLEDADKAFFAQQIAQLINLWVLAKQLHEKRLLSGTLFEGGTKFVVSVLLTKGAFEFLEMSWRYFAQGQELFEIVNQAKGIEPSFSDVQPWWRAD